jgi:dienelactone hydrolase
MNFTRTPCGAFSRVGQVLLSLLFVLPILGCADGFQPRAAAGDGRPVAEVRSDSPPASAPGQAGASSKPLDGKGKNMMRAYMQGLYDSVPFSMDQVRTDEDWPAWRTRTLRDLRKALGLERFPDRTPLNPRVVGTLDREGYVVEKIVFETRPDFLMTANLYRPAKVTGRVPAVLCVHGHTNNGKTSGEMQIRAINAARAGWVAMTVDATGHGERTHIGHRRTWAIITAGMTLEGVQVWDNMRSIDYLISRPEVDPTRIGISGCSGGGNQTMYTAAIDDRIAMAAPTCSVSTLRGQIFTPNGIGCQCECIPDLMACGLENAVVCALLAPRPLLVLAGSQDQTFPVQYTRVADEHLKRFYTAIGMPEKYAYVERPVPHGYSAPLREASQAWFDRWFNGRKAEVAWNEPETKTEAAADLWCFPDGNLPDDSATLGTLACDTARKLLAEVKVPTTERDRARLRRQIRDDVLGGWPTEGSRIDLNPEISLPPPDGQAPTPASVVCQHVTLHSETGVTIRLRITQPAAPAGQQVAPRPIMALLRAAPADTPWVHTAALLAKGYAVVELDCRRTSDAYVDLAALVLGRPMVGQVAFDVTRAVDYLATREDLNAGNTVLWADGPEALAALYAVVLDGRIGGAVLTGLLSTYLCPKPVQLPQWTFARGLLRYADIEHLAGAVAPRPLVIANPVGPDLKPLDTADLAKAFAATRAAHGRAGTLNIVVGDDATVLESVRSAFPGPRQ